MTTQNENPKSNLVTFRPKQKTFELNGKSFVLPDYVGRNAVRYVFDINNKIMLKVCLDCEKHSEVLQLDEENGLFSDIHDEADVGLSTLIKTFFCRTITFYILLV